MVGSSLDPQMLDPKNYEWFPELLRCCLLRTLTSYTGRPTAAGGTEPRPDLAVAMPDASADGLTWTFRLKRGLTYAPPFEDVEITAGDVVRALERRIAIPAESTPSPAWGYSFYFSPIVGLDAYLAGDASTIAGLAVPDPHTLVVSLSEPVGDLAYRFALPATAPVPEGAAKGHASDYGRFLVSSGPYNVEGADEVDYSLPADEQLAASGYVPPTYDPDGIPTADGSMVLVRNPSWRRATDGLRRAFVDRIEITIVGGSDPAHSRLSELLRGVETGRYDVDELMWWAPKGWLEDPSHRLETHEMNSFTYEPMNVAMPPLDDVHVRKAIALMLDRDAVQAASAAIAPSAPSSRILPDSLEGGLLAGWEPGWLTASGSDLSAARAEMARSRYDRDGDGRCEAAACRSVRTLVMRQSETWSVPLWPWRRWAHSLTALGIWLDVHTAPVTRFGSGFWRHAMRPSERNALLVGWTGWIADYPNASTVFIPMLQHPTDEWNNDLSLIGATSDQLHRWRYTTDRVPNIDEQINRCMVRTGREQIVCWAELDQYLMNEIVPWIPISADVLNVALSDRIDRYSFDQSLNAPAYDQISLVPGSE